MGGGIADPNALMSGSYGIPSGPFTVGMGQGWLPYYQAQQGLLANLYNSQGQLGQNLLGSLLKLTSDPAAGPLGLAAFGHFGGGGQAVAQGTGGAGVQSPYGGLLDQLLSGLSQSVMNPGSPFNPANHGQYNPGAAKIDPTSPPTMAPTSAGAAPNATEEFFKNWSNNAYTPEQQQTLKNIAGVPHVPATPGPFQNPQLATGGGMIIGGQRHYIVDESGTPVADLTEDGKPEHVGGVGGVEVTPMDPVRKAQYEAAKAHGGMLGELLGNHLATGGTALFPQYPTQTAHTATAQTPTTPAQDASGTGTPTFRTQGGSDQTRGQQVGDYFKSVFDPAKGTFSLPGEATDATTTNDNAGFAKLLGGALSAGNMAVDPAALQRLNSGLAPDQFFNAATIRSMLPSQQQSYFALLQQMGLGNEADIKDQIAKGRPAALG